MQLFEIVGQVLKTFVRKTFILNKKDRTLNLGLGAICNILDRLKIFHLMPLSICLTRLSFFMNFHNMNCLEITQQISALFDIKQELMFSTKCYFFNDLESSDTVSCCNL